MALRHETHGSIDVYRPPQVMSIFARGVDERLGQVISLYISDFRPIPTGYMGRQYALDSRTNDDFSTVDFSFIVQIIMSLFALILAYNSISGELENGTLRMILANAVPRHLILLGKFIGGMTVLVASLFLSAGLALLIVLAHPAVNFGSEDFLRFLLFAGVSILYIGVFYIFGILLSIAIRSSSKGIIVACSLWFMLAVVYPHALFAVAQNVYVLPDELGVMRIKQTAAQDLRDISSTLFDEQMRLSAEGYQANRERIEAIMAQRHDVLMPEINKVYYQVDREIINRYCQVSGMDFGAGLLSPMLVYNKITARLSLTGYHEYYRFIEIVYNYWLLLDDDPEYFNDPLKRPSFMFNQPGISQAIIGILDDVLILVLAGMALFIVAHVLFLRMEVK